MSQLPLLMPPEGTPFPLTPPTAPEDELDEAGAPPAAPRDGAAASPPTAATVAQDLARDAYVIGAGGAEGAGAGAGLGAGAGAAGGGREDATGAPPVAAPTGGGDAVEPSCVAGGRAEGEGRGGIKAVTMIRVVPRTVDDF